MTVLPSTETIWSQLSSDLRRFIRRRVPDDHLADDLLQEAFVRIHRAIATLEHADRLEAWVYRIARNVIHDHFRAANRTQQFDETDAVEDIGEDPGRRACGGAAWLHELIRSLPDDYRAAVQLSEIEGLSQAEVGVRLGLSLSGAKSRVQRGRALLKRLLLECCHFDFDGRGSVLDCAPRPGGRSCEACSE